MNFETREVTRTADSTEQADLIKRLLEVLSSIDTTQEEAKAIAADYRGIIGDLRKREIGLRFNLQTGTVTQEIEVHAMPNEITGMMEYYNREGVEVVELRHPMSEKQKEQEALQRQLNMFGQEPTDEHKLTSVTISTSSGQSVTLDEESANGEQHNSNDIFNASPSGTPIGDIADLVAVIGIKNLSDEQPVTVNGDPSTYNQDEQPEAETSDRFDPADLDQLQTDAEAAGMLPEKPVKKGKKTTSQPVTV